MFGTTLFFCLLATLLACIEIEAEGKYGWAQKMPTWYRVTGLPARLYGLLMGGKPLTGYHLFMFLLPGFMFHSHFAMGVAWSIEGELKAMAMYFAVCPLWDYYWFVLNPWYQGKFTKKDVGWHAKSLWIMGFPLDYYMGFGLSVLLASAAAWWSGDQSALFDHGRMLGGFAVYTVFLYVMSPLYRKWYWHMRRPGSDERHLASILHTAPPDGVDEWAFGFGNEPLIVIEFYVDNRDSKGIRTARREFYRRDDMPPGMALQVEIESVYIGFDASVRVVHETPTLQVVE